MSEYGLRDAECIWVDRIVVDHPTDGGFTDHVHPRAQLAWAARGEITVSMTGTRWVLSPSQAIWIPADQTHDVRATRGSELFCVYVWEEECSLSWSGLTVLAMDGLARELVRYLHRDDLDDVVARHARATLLGSLRPTRAAGVHLPMPEHPAARHLADRLLEDPTGPCSLEDWARRLHTSAKTLQRAFTAQTGMTYSQWRTQARLYRALPLLADSVPISVVATHVGYESTNGFAGAFRRHFGTTPGDYFGS